MFLKRFELQGFKSFADKTRLEFGEGISTIVGPNGSGKSNISDAVMWVMGEQRLKSLRSANVKDIIFSGSDTRKALGMASVSMTMNNESGLLPLPYEEVTVTRKAFRSGESEFFINKTPCRLKDIQNLFHDTGIGRDSFAMIGQGRVHEIVSSKAEDRRAMIEEIAGIVKYRNRKNESLRKIDQTQQNLLRVLDIISELEVNLVPLGQEAEKAESYLAIKDELDQLDINLLVYDIDQADQEKNTIKASLSLLEETVVGLEADMAKEEASFEEERLEIDRITELLAEKKEALYQLKNQSQQMAAQVEVSETKLDHLSQRRQELEADRLDLEDKLETLRQQNRTKTEDHLALKDSLEEKLSTLETLENRLSFLEEEKKDREEKLDQTQGQSLDEMQYLASLNNEYNKLAYERENYLSQEDKNRQKAREEAAALEGLKKESKALDVALEKAGQEKEDLDQKTQALLAKEEEKKNKAQALGEKLGGWQKESQVLSSRMRALMDIQKDHDGYFYGVKNLLKEKEAQPQKRAGILGVVADLISMDKKYVAAVESALGSSLQHVITENQEEAKAAIDFLKKARAGRATFLPLTTIRPRRLSSANQPVLDMPGVLGTANQLISYDKKVAPALEHLLGAVLVTQDLEAAIQASKALKEGLKTVSLEGDVIHPGGAMSGGHREKKRASILGRKAEIQDLKSQVDQLEKRIKEKSQVFEDLASQIEASGREKVSLKTQLEAANQAYQQKRQEKDFLTKQIKAKEMELEIYSLDEADLKAQKTNLELSEEEIGARIQASQAKKEALEAAIEDYKSQQADLADKLKEKTDERNQLMLAKVSIQEKEAAMQSSLALFYQREEEMDSQLKKMAAEKDRLDEETRGHDQVLVSLNKDIEKKGDEVESLIFYIQDKDKEKESLTNSVADKIARTKALRKETEAKKKDLHAQEIRLTKLESQLENKTKRLEERHQLSYPQACEKKTPIKDLKEAGKRLALLKKEMSFLGTVNLSAIDDYARIKERYDFLSNQETDLRQSIEKLDQVIQEIDQVMTRRFKESFSQVAEAFTSSFTTLFGGGDAKLTLSQPHDLLETGVDIEARPPGKALKNMNLLSGGEKALTAIALLFAFLRVKPSPFCVLDEIDAALDETNVVHFSEYLKTFTDHTQFVVISHRQGTIENSDTLYGVTMDKKSGITKTISVSLAEKIPKQEKEEKEKEEKEKEAERAAEEEAEVEEEKAGKKKELA